MDNQKMIIEGLNNAVYILETDRMSANTENSKFIKSAELAIEKAITLIEKNAPRILGLREILALQRGEVVWLEDSDKSDIIPGLVYRSFIMTRSIEFQVIGRVVNGSYDDYNRRWRCWTAHPSNKERAETPWQVV